MRWPWSRRRVLNPGGDAVLVRDTGSLRGDELMDLGGGRFVRFADLLDMPDVIEVVGEDGR